MSPKPSSPTQQAGPMRLTGAETRYLDDRTKVAVAVKELGRKVFPDHWSFLLGEIALYSFIVILLTGTFLTLFFQASMEETEYLGPYVPMKGVEMSAAMASTLDISFSVRGGLLMRQAHHWAALLFVASIGLHMLRIFFTGAFRKPRELNWVIGFVLFILAIAEGLTGYSLPDDVLSGNGLRIIDGLFKSFPVVGTYLSYFFFVFGVIVLIASFVGINPIWNYGPYDPSPVSAGTQPDWYVGFADGILRLVPPGLETEWFGYTWSWNMLLPILAIGLFFVLVALYPFIEAWATGDRREHHVLDRPRNAPTRTAIGASGVTFYAVLWAGASSDLMATHFQLSMEGVIHTLQACLVLGPVVAYWGTKRICLALQKKDRSIALHGYESGRIVRMPTGEFIEVHKPLDEYESWQLVSYHDYSPVTLRPNDDGRIPFSKRLRAGLSRWFFEDRIVPPSEGEIEAGKQGGH